MDLDVEPQATLGVIDIEDPLVLCQPACISGTELVSLGIGEDPLFSGPLTDAK